MKRKISSLLALLLVLVLALGIVSCGAGSSMNEGYYGEDNLAGEMGSTDPSIKTDTDDSVSYSDGTKIIKNASVSAETQEWDKSTESLKTLISKYSGHIANSSVTENASYRSDGEMERRASYTIKIPSEQFDAFLDELSDIFNVTNSSTTTEDVSESYFTLQARIETLESKRLGLENMLKNVDANLDFATWKQLNDELSEVETQLTMYNNQLENLKNKVAYSTINLSVSEVVEYTETEEKAYGEQVVDAFTESFAIFVEVLKGLLIVIIYLLPLILVILAFALLNAGCAAIIVVIIRSIIKRKRNKKKKQANLQ